MKNQNDTTRSDPEGCAVAYGSQLVTVSDALKWAMDLCREARDNAENLARYYAKGKKHKALAEESRLKAANANVAIAHLERVLAENGGELSRMAPKGGTTT